VVWLSLPCAVVPLTVHSIARQRHGPLVDGTALAVQMQTHPAASTPAAVSSHLLLVGISVILRHTLGTYNVPAWSGSA
jgi:hypothetical protein